MVTLCCSTMHVQCTLLLNILILSMRQKVLRTYPFKRRRSQKFKIDSKFVLNCVVHPLDHSQRSRMPFRESPNMSQDRTCLSFHRKQHTRCWCFLFFWRWKLRKMSDERKASDTLLALEARTGAPPKLVKTTASGFLLSTVFWSALSKKNKRERKDISNVQSDSLRPRSLVIFIAYLGNVTRWSLLLSPYFLSWASDRPRSVGGRIV